MYNNSSVVIKGDSSIQFNNNTAKSGGALCIETNSTLTIKENSFVIFNSNEADDLGGAIHLTKNSDVLFIRNSSKPLISLDDAAMLLNSSHAHINISVIIIFINNKAIQGGVVYFNSRKTH